MQYAAISALQGKADSEVNQMIGSFKKRRKLLCDLLREIPKIKFYVPQGAFYVLCDISFSQLNADEFAKKLLEQEKLAVIPCTAFGTPNCIRLSYACSEENITEAVKRLKNFINRE